ncbi:MAG: hypothetical protein J6I65_04475, partial [Lachnospiraceae bacterium]|nr:hypothetical protein [Lachnospiraceae bacterium]
ENDYRNQLEGAASPEEKQASKKEQTITGKIVRITQAVVGGNSHYYLMLENNNEIFDVNVAEHINIIRYDTGHEITLTYIKKETPNASPETPEVSPGTSEFSGAENTVNTVTSLQ